MSQVSESQADFWEGYRTALIMMNVELDKFFSSGYNARDSRARDDILDLKLKIKEMLDCRGREPVL